MPSGSPKVKKIRKAFNERSFHKSRKKEETAFRKQFFSWECYDRYTIWGKNIL